MGAVHIPALGASPLVAGRCVRCHAEIGTGYICDSCEAENLRLLAARQSRDAMDGLVKRLRESKLPLRYGNGTLSLETFDANTPERKSAADRVADWSKALGAPWLYLFGPVGTGKTGLAASGLHAAILRGSRGSFVSLSDLLGRMRCTFGRNDGESDYDIAEEYRHVRFLVLDDLGTEKPTPWTLQVLIDLINVRYETRARTIITSNYKIGQLVERLSIPGEEVAAERIVDRMFEIAVPVPLTGASHRQKERG